MERVGTDCMSRDMGGGDGSAIIVALRVWVE